MRCAGQINHLIGQGKIKANNRYGYKFDIQKLLEIKKLGAKLIFKPGYIDWRWKKVFHKGDGKH